MNGPNCSDCKRNVQNPKTYTALGLFYKNP